MADKSKLREWREMNKLSLNEASKLLDMHLSHLSLIERGKRKPTLSMALKIDKVTYGYVTPYDWGINKGGD